MSRKRALWCAVVLLAATVAGMQTVLWIEATRRMQGKA